MARSFTSKTIRSRTLNASRTKANHLLSKDSAVNAFIIVSNITNSIQQSAIEYLVTALKDANLWSKFYAIYPFVGATISTHPLNLVNPVTFKITWGGTPTHGVFGVQFNGTNNYGRTALIPSTTTTLNDVSIHCYNYTDIQSGIILGSSNSGSTQQLRVQPRSSGNASCGVYDTPNLSLAVFDATGLFSASKIASNNLMLFKNGVLLNTSTTSSGTRPTLEVYIGANNTNGTAGSFKDCKVAFAGIASGLTSSECTTLNTIVEYFQGILSRNSIRGLNITYEGDSFMDPTNVNLGARIDLVLDGMSYFYTSVNYGISGSTIGYPEPSNKYLLFATRYNAVTGNYNATARKNILAVWEGTNDLFFYLNNGFTMSDSVTNVYNNYVSYYSTLAVYGYKVVLNTITPRTDASAVSLNYETGRQNASNKLDPATINGLLRIDFNIPTSQARIFKSGLSKWANCVLVDMGDDPVMGQINQSNDTTYYNADKLHPNATGGNLMASYYGSAIDLLTQNIYF